MSFSFYSFILFILYMNIFFDAYPYTIYFITLARCFNNEHEDNQEIQSKFDFERMQCTDDNDSEEYMDNETLPLEMKRLIDQENKQILPLQEETEVINLGNNEEKKEEKKEKDTL